MLSWIEHEKSFIISRPDYIAEWFNIVMSVDKSSHTPKNNNNNNKKKQQKKQTKKNKQNKQQQQQQKQQQKQTNKKHWCNITVYNGLCWMGDAVSQGILK